MSGIKRISTYSFRLPSGLQQSRRASKKTEEPNVEDDDEYEGDFGENSSDERITEHEMLPCLQGSDWSSGVNKRTANQSDCSNSEKNPSDWSARNNNLSITACASDNVNDEMSTTRNSALFLMERIEKSDDVRNSPKKVSWLKYESSLQ